MTAAQESNSELLAGLLHSKANCKSGCCNDDRFESIFNSLFSFCQYQSPGTMWFTSVDIMQQEKNCTSKLEDQLKAILAVKRTDYCSLKQLLPNEKLE